MPPEPSIPYLLRASFDDFDQFGAATRGWDLETVLLERGGFRGEIIQYFDPESQTYFTHTRYRCKLKQLGSPPPRVWTFCVPAYSGFEMDWRRQTVSGNDIAVFPLGSELYASARPDFDVYTVSYPDETIMSAASEMGYPRFRSFLLNKEVFRSNDRDLAPLRLSLGSLRQLIHGPTAAVRSILARDVLQGLIRTIANAAAKDECEAVGLKEKAVRQAEDWIHQRVDDPITVRDLCRVTGVSDRTLQIGFRERFGVSPKSFINAVRLGKVHQALLTSDPAETQVNNVANGWGFWHMGQFAADYRRMFQELPSETLIRSHFRGLP